MTAVSARIVLCRTDAKLESAALEMVQRWMPASEVEGIRRLRRWEDAQASSIGGSCFRCSAGWQLMAPDRCIGTAEGGRVSLSMFLSVIDCILSHCSGYVVAAVSENGRVGIDVETDGGRDPSVDADFLTPSELAWLCDAGPPDGRSAIRLWTLKEAYVKGTGEGLARNVLTLDFEMSAPRITVRVRGKPEETERWHFRSRSLPEAWLSISNEFVEPPADVTLIGCREVARM